MVTKDSNTNFEKLEKLAILDAGAQYGKVIDRRVRELNVETDFLSLDVDLETIKQYKGIIISGGPESVYSPNAPSYNRKLFFSKVPILGICYGMQLMNYARGGTVEKKERREDCETIIGVWNKSILFKNLEGEQQVLMSHGDSIAKLAKGFEQIAFSNNIVAGIENTEKNLYGVQFHPEVDLTTNGKTILKNFLFDICKFKGSYSMENRVQTTIDQIKTTVADKNVLVLVSGGVDSTVTAALLTKSLDPNQIYAIHIDNGFMRKDESKKVEQALKSLGLKNLVVVDAKNEFYNGKTVDNELEIGPLNQIIEPEQKRKIIGDVFMHVADQAMKSFNLDLDDTFIAQGTLRPDLIESASLIASDKASVIKTHHNDTELVRKKRKKGLVIETNKDWHKDEVRKVGEMLDLPKELIWRHPFPGPGLAVRIICADEPNLDEDGYGVQSHLDYLAGTYDFKGAILPFKTVGVQGDDRSYRYVAALSSENNPDWVKAKQAANEIPKVIHEINRVVYLFGDPVEDAVQNVTKTNLTPDIINLLQEADSIVTENLFKYDIYKSFAQVPVVLFPVDFDNNNNNINKNPKKHSITIRTFRTNDFMTGMPAIPGKDFPEHILEKIVDQILSLNKVSRVVYDLTSKPPGTVEWE